MRRPLESVQLIFDLNFKGEFVASKEESRTNAFRPRREPAHRGNRGWLQR